MDRYEEIKQLFADVTGFTLREPGGWRRLQNYWAGLRAVEFFVDLSDSNSEALREDDDERELLAKLLTLMLPYCHCEAVPGKPLLNVTIRPVDPSINDTQENGFPNFRPARAYMNVNRDELDWICQHFDAYRREIRKDRDMQEMRGEWGKKADEAAWPHGSVAIEDVIIKMHDWRGSYYTLLTPQCISRGCGQQADAFYDVPQQRPDPGAEAMVDYLNVHQVAGEHVRFFIHAGETKKYQPFRIYFRRDDGDDLRPEEIQNLFGAYGGGGGYARSVLFTLLHNPIQFHEWRQWDLRETMQEAAVDTCDDLPAFPTPPGEAAPVPPDTRVVTGSSLHGIWRPRRWV